MERLLRGTVITMLAKKQNSQRGVKELKDGLQDSSDILAKHFIPIIRQACTCIPLLPHQSKLFFTPQTDVANSSHPGNWDTSRNRWTGSKVITVAIKQE